MNGKKFYLSQTDKKVSGVCGGIAEYFDIDSTIVRVATILIIVFSGFFPGVIAYIIIVAISPKGPETNIIDADKVAK